ncbi:TerB family tellurite resistance protein [Aromatoleum diolicum]|uniref:TerB family tellurite resistance protein n=1 Tax=Aromatoleum diolicum TaxID=75796 RepID=A0ABX1QC33_9RHOO|nr:TerB family tellurite resistance protein [Aromatoleum diolicum]NMG74957.1 TerB family tellurite resistance protein [Aromatoleum diolicum]
MLTKLMALLSGEIQAEGLETGPFERRHIAVAALLLEAMYIDHRTSEREHAAISRLLREHFALPEEAAQQLVAVADERFAEVLDDWEFAEAVRAGFNLAERHEVLTMLWEVAYADGDLVRLEDRLVSRLAQQLEIDPEAADAARATAVARAGLLGDGG